MLTAVGIGCKRGTRQVQRIQGWFLKYRAGRDHVVEPFVLLNFEPTYIPVTRNA